MPYVKIDRRQYITALQSQEFKTMSRNSMGFEQGERLLLMKLSKDHARIKTKQGQGRI
jgi:hypothetical protein